VKIAQKPFVVAILGRPNVGKSSLFNALLGYRRSIVLDHPGTTLDRVAEEGDFGGGPFRLVDSEGILDETKAPMLGELLGQADVCVFVVDALTGLTPFDTAIANVIRARGIPTLVCVNKTESKKSEGELAFSSLPFKDFLGISAAHKKNLEQVKAWCLKHQQKSGKQVTVDPQAAPPLTLAFIGRPNTGKSTLMNRLCRESVSRVSPQPLTTRDPVSFELESREGHRFRLVDTAGIRRPRSKKNDVEVYSIHASTRQIREADVVFLLIASHEPISDQDVRLLSLLEREGKPAAVLLNFWDRLTPKERNTFVRESEFAPFISRFKTLPISGVTGFNVEKTLSLARKLAEQAKRRVTTSKLNKIVEKMIEKNPPPARGNQNFNILYASQVATEPPTFVFFMNRKEHLPDSYKRYLENQLRKELQFRGQAIRVFFRARE